MTSHLFPYTLCRMARPFRLQFPGAISHLTARGNARQAIYLDDADRYAFLRLLGREVLEKWGQVSNYRILPATLSP